MKQRNKSMIVRFKILQVALNEFANYSYEKSSINRICTEGNISKGVMYHHFKDKDELYLLCISYCYDTMLDYYKNRLKVINNKYGGVFAPRGENSTIFIIYYF